jgi:hypothetical protein
VTTQLRRTPTTALRQYVSTCSALQLFVDVELPVGISDCHAVARRDILRPIKSTIASLSSILPSRLAVHRHVQFLKESLIDESKTTISKSMNRPFNSALSEYLVTITSLTSHHKRNIKLRDK